jgi:hypothetical protein
VQLLRGLSRAVTFRSKSGRTHDHILMSHLRLSQTWWARYPYLYPPETGWPSWCGGGLEYLHPSPVSRKRRRKGNPVTGGIAMSCKMSKVKVISRLTVSRPVYLGVRHPSRTRDQFFPNFFNYFQTVMGLLMWEALSDERSDL